MTIMNTIARVWTGGAEQTVGVGSVTSTPHYFPFLYPIRVAMGIFSVFIVPLFE